MSKIGEKIAWQINQIFPPLGIHRHLENAKLDISANQAWSLAEARRVVKYFYPYWNLEDKHLLDIGTGIGGKLSLYRESGVRAITGIDITFEGVSVSHQYIRDTVDPTNTTQQFFFGIADAADMPFADNTFDAIVSINVFEHIMELENAIQESYRVLKPGGLAFLHVPPYYGPWGPHLENWIHFPWPHLIFSDRTLLKVAEREDERRPLNDKFVYTARVDWNAEKIEGINRVSFRRFHRLISEAGFTIISLKLLPVGYDYLENRPTIVSKLLYKLLQIATRVPILQEAVITKMVYVLAKPNGK